jgi:hypothetical protein
MCELLFAVLRFLAIFKPLELEEAAVLNETSLWPFSGLRGKAPELPFRSPCDVDSRSSSRHPSPTTGMRSRPLP